MSTENIDWENISFYWINHGFIGIKLGNILSYVLHAGMGWCEIMMAW